jgi:hypothetical protein
MRVFKPIVFCVTNESLNMKNQKAYYQGECIKIQIVQ